MNNLQELWADKRNRMIAVMGVIGLVVVLLALAMTDEEEVREITIKQEKPKEGSLFGASNAIEQVSEQDASTMLDRMTGEYERSQERWRNERKVLENQNSELSQQLLQIQQQQQNLEQQMIALSRGEGTVVPRQRTSPDGRVPVQQSPSGIDPVQAERINTGQTQLITRGPSLNSPIIRTITQRTIRTLRDGEITQQNVETQTINGRGVSRVEPIALDSRAPLDKVEEEGLELFTLSMGSIISGTLLNGVPAPTGLDNASEPVPVLMRIKREAIMPNHYTLDIVDCHLLGSAVGSLSSSRALIRAESISCNTHTGEAIEKQITAYAVDAEDGMAGIQGDVVFKSGAMIANTMLATGIQGFADAFSPNRVNAINTSPSATELWQTQNMDRAVGAGIGRGFSGGAERIADYYMHLAEQTFPVIELIPGIEVDFIVQKGMTLRLGGREKPYTNNRMEAVDGLAEIKQTAESINLPRVSVDLGVK